MGMVERMALRYRPSALAFRIVAVVAIAAGIVRLAGLFSGAPVWTTFTYYTAMSNVLCLGWMLVLAAATVRDLARHGTRGVTAPAPRLSAAVMMAITVTMLIYLVLLAPTAFAQSGGEYVPFGLTDNLVHIICPCLLILDWLLFAPKGRLRRFDPLLWTLIPYAYLVFALVWAGTGREFGPGVAYPYPFLDVALHGVGGVALWIVGLSVALVGVGYVYLALDHVLGRVGSRAESVRTVAE